MQIDTSLCTIMKNCADVIPTFYSWAVENFDEINIVVDPNNDDDTYQYVMDINRINPFVHVLTHEFDDFSSQKQRAYDMCMKQYAILIDSDEIIEEMPENGIANFMKKVKADVGVLRRYNFQGDDEHFIHYPDSQFRVIKMNSGIRMNGKFVDETLATNSDHILSLLPWNILHYGHIRPTEALKLKGKDRIKFANCDDCDGSMLKTHGEGWFIKRNEIWNQYSLSVPKYIVDYSRKYRVKI